MPSEIQSQKYEKALHYEIFVKKEYWFANNEITKAWCIFDIGWHVGYFSLRCLALWTTAQIHYFEPVKDFYEQAKTNLIGCPNVILNNYGIWAKKEIWFMFLNEEKTMQSSKFHSFLNSSTNKIEVRFDILKNYIINNGIKKIDVLKLDVEGMEFEIFNSRSDFEWWKINNLIAEIHILDEEMLIRWNDILPIIQKHFKHVKIIESWYRKEIFLIYAKKL